MIPCSTCLYEVGSQLALLGSTIAYVTSRRAKMITALNSLTPESRSSLLERQTLFNLLSCCVGEGEASAIKLHTGEIAQIMLPSDWAMCEVL